MDTPEPGSERFLLQRLRMVEDHLRKRRITDERVLRAFERTPREGFVPEHLRGSAYADEALPIGHGQTISQPYVVALTLQELDLHPGQKVLDIGAGSGYQTALLAKLSGHVYAIERIDAITQQARRALDELAIENVTLVTGDGSLGWAEHAPFDRIVCGAGGPDVPQSWIEQLADGGRIVMPVGPDFSQQLIAVDKRGGKIYRRPLLGVRFVRLIGEQGWPG